MLSVLRLAALRSVGDARTMVNKTRLAIRFPQGIQLELDGLYDLLRNVEAALNEFHAVDERIDLHETSKGVRIAAARIRGLSDKLQRVATFADAAASSLQTLAHAAADVCSDER